MFVDARVQLRLGRAEEAGPEDALLIEGDGPAEPGRAAAYFRPAPSAHPPGCACCLPRGAAARALTRLFLARARGEVPQFRRVLAVPATEAGEADLRAALLADPLVSGRFRLVT